VNQTPSHHPCWTVACGNLNSLIKQTRDFIF